MSVPIDFLSRAVALAAPEAAFSINPEKDGYAALKMLDGSRKPTEAEIESAWEKREEPLPDPTDRQLILWLMRDLSEKEKATAFQEALQL